MRIGVADSALKHGVAYGRVLDVARFGDLLGADTTGLLWWVGVASDNRTYEVAGLSTLDGAIILIHAMPMKWRKR